MAKPLKRKNPNTARRFLDPKRNLKESQQEALNVLGDEALIKQLESAVYAEEIRKKALDVLCKRVADREISENMLLRIAVSLAKVNRDLWRLC
jgi:hypothetical protein